MEYPDHISAVAVSPALAEEEITETESEDDTQDTWIKCFCNVRGNEYFCEVEPEFILDRFNLTGLGQNVPHAQQAFNVLTDYNFDDSDDPDNLDWKDPTLEASTRFLYGLIHARYIISPNGLHRMKRKYLAGEFGTCPRVLCGGQHLIPVGLSDVPRSNTVKLFCCHCEDVYNPKSTAHNSIDGSYFGTTFPHLFFQTYPMLRPDNRSKNVYVPKIFGFKVATAERIQEMKALLEVERSQNRMNASTNADMA